MKVHKIAHAVIAYPLLMPFALQLNSNCSVTSCLTTESTHTTRRKAKAKAADRGGEMLTLGGRNKQATADNSGR